MQPELSTLPDQRRIVDYERYRNCVGSGHAGAPITPFCMRGWLHRNLYRY
jgi:hypothetical protein